MSDVPEIKGKPAAKIHVQLHEKVGLANYSNVEYGASVTRFVEDTPAGIKKGLSDGSNHVEKWMLEYYRDHVAELVEASAGDIKIKKS